MTTTRKIGGAAGVQPLSARFRRRALDVLRRKAEEGDVAACESLVRLPLSAASRRRALDVLRRRAEEGDVAACETLIRLSLERQLAKSHHCPCLTMAEQQVDG